MDAGTIRNFKCNYKNLLCKHFLNCIEEDKQQAAYLDSLNNRGTFFPRNIYNLHGIKSQCSRKLDGCPGTTRQPPLP